MRKIGETVDGGYPVGFLVDAEAPPLSPRGGTLASWVLGKRRGVDSRLRDV